MIKWTEQTDFVTLSGEIIPAEIKFQWDEWGVRSLIAKDLNTGEQFDTYELAPWEYSELFHKIKLQGLNPKGLVKDVKSGKTKLKLNNNIFTIINKNKEIKIEI